MGHLLRSMKLWIDADACPVKDEALKVAARHQLAVTLVGNSWMRGLDHPLVSQIVAPPGADAADDLIVEGVAEGDVVVTQDIRLAARVIAKNALAVDPRGRPFDEASIGMKVAVRDLMADLRDQGVMTGGPAGFSKQDRSRFLDGLERVIQAAKRGR